MRDPLPAALERARLSDTNTIYDTEPGSGPTGAYLLAIKRPAVMQRQDVLRIIASDGKNADSKGWEHVSVSLVDRAPTWHEMCAVKELFWDDEAWVVQFHPARSQYVNHHPHCLHLWHNNKMDFPTPPTIFVGPMQSSPQ